MTARSKPRSRSAATDKAASVVAKPALPGSRGIDHLVVAVADLEAGRALWSSLGFTLTPRAEHPWGTANHLAQLDHCFIEILAVADPAKIKATTKKAFSFGAFNRDFLKKREGASMLVLESADADADIADFASHGLETFQRFDFERMAGQPDGEQARVAFSLAITRAPGVKATGFFTCHQHEPEHFWHAKYQRHANSARSIVEIVLVAADPADHHIFLEAFAGTRMLKATSFGIEAATARGRIAIVTPAAFRFRFGPETLPDAPKDLEIRAVTFAVDNFGNAATSLIAGGLRVTTRGDLMIVGPDQALGLTVAFQQPST